MNKRLAKLATLFFFVLASNAGNAIDQTITVAKSGGDYSSIKNALASIHDNSETKRYVISIGPGTFSVTEQINMKPFVSIRGSGIESTVLVSRIRSPGSRGAMFMYDAIDNNKSAISDLAVDMYINSTYLSAVIFSCEFACPELRNLDLQIRTNLTDIALRAIDLVVAELTINNTSIRVRGRSSSSVGIVDALTSVVHLDNSQISAPTAISSCETFGTINNSMISGATTISGGDCADSEWRISHSRLSASSDGFLVDTGDLGSGITADLRFSTIVRGMIEPGTLTCAYAINDDGLPLDRDCLLIP